MCEFDPTEDRTKCSGSRFRGYGRNGKCKQLEKRFNSVYMASDFYLSIWACWNTEMQRVQANQCQFCVLKPKKISPFVPSW